MWCGRNEGVPQPIINEGLTDLTSKLDGTRYYSPSSNQVNLQNSGPYKFMDPALYYTTLNHGFSVETGTPSFSTLESFRASVPKEDQWPIDDAWAYHDWHASGNGDIAPFMAQLQAQFGAATSLEDFERKAQMLNYVEHRAIFEGMNAHLWAPNSGRMLWMTQPAWPSNYWQILSHDYDTQASFYGVKKACEPVHVQLDLSNYGVTVVNTTPDTLKGLTVVANAYSLENKPLLRNEQKLDIAADSAVDGSKLELAPLFSNGVLLVKLELKNADGKLLSAKPYEKVNWATSIDLETGRPVDSDVSKKLLAGEQVELWPSTRGGKNWPHAAFNPETGLLYANTQHMASLYRFVPLEPFAAGMRYQFVENKTAPHAAGDPVGHVDAIDPMTAEPHWRAPLLDHPHWSSIVATGGGLLFTGKETGEFIAIDAETGTTVWQFQTGSGINAQPITFTHNGKQYITVLSGIGGLYWNAARESLKNVPQGGSVWTFALAQ